MVDENYAGVSGLLRYNVEDLAVRVEEGGRSLSVRFSQRVEQLPRRTYGELLDTVRFQTAEEIEVSVIVEYGRLRQDLPPMYEHDTLTCFWEVRDVLG